LTEQTDSELDRIDTVAADWVARLGGPSLSDKEAEELALWLEADTRHAKAFDEAQTTWRKMEKLRFAPGELANNVPAQDTGARLLAKRFSSRHLRRQAGAIAASLLIVLLGVGFWYGDPLLAITADFQTAPGERRSLTLADGSVIELGPASAISIQYSADERRIDLHSGLAYFSVMPVKQNSSGNNGPFVVHTANGTAQALGTEFMVNRLETAVDVTVIDHEVAVHVNDTSSEAVLSRGQGVRYSETGLGTVRNIDLRHATAWRRGRLIFDRIPLGEVVEALNRYRRGRIVIVNPRLAARNVSGAFDVEDPERLLETITRELQIATTSLPPLVTLLY